jgi:hypothetical protein
MSVMVASVSASLLVLLLAWRISDRIDPKRASVLVMGLFAVLVAVLCARATRATLQLQAHGLRTTAQMVRLQREETHGLRGSTTVYRDPIVSFTPAGSSSIEARIWNNAPRVRIGDQVQVLYLKEAPASTAIIDQGWRNWLGVLMMGITAVLLLLISTALARRCRPTAPPLLELGTEKPVFGLPTRGTSCDISALAATRGSAFWTSTARAADSPGTTVGTAPPVRARTLGRFGYRGWTMVLFALDIAILFAPPIHKTGYVALGAILVPVVCVIGAFGIIATLVAKTLVGISRLASVSRGRDSNDWQAGAATSPLEPSDALGPTALPAGYVRLNLWLWKLVFWIVSLSTALMGVGFVLRLITAALLIALSM